MSIKLIDIYKACVDKGIANDPRSPEEIEALLAEKKQAFDKLEDAEKEFFDSEKLTNPYSDTRICFGDPALDIRGLIVGIDMEVGEILLADRMRESGKPVDLVFAHHPEGIGYASMHEVMGMQADIWAAQGVSVAAGDRLIETRAQEVRRKIMPANHYRAVDAARLLDIAFLSCHTPADNSVTRFVQSHLDEKAPRTLNDIVKVLREIPEYADAARKGYGPNVIGGKGSNRAGRIVVDMTGGTEGPSEALDKLVDAGVGTLVGMHYSEDHRKHAEKINLNLVIAGHVSSDAIGMNLVLDEVEKLGEVEIFTCSGMIRVKR